MGPRETMEVCLGDGSEGVKNQKVEDISSQQIDTAPLIPSVFFPSLLDMICIANGCSVALAFFLESVRKDGGWERCFFFFLSV